MMHRMTWLNSLGAEWRKHVRLGYINELYTEFYQPFSPRVGLFVAPWLNLRQDPSPTISVTSGWGNTLSSLSAPGSSSACRERSASCEWGFSRGTEDGRPIRHPQHR